jgi:hypothetical protein
VTDPGSIAKVTPPQDLLASGVREDHPVEAGVVRAEQTFHLLPQALVLAFEQVEVFLHGPVTVRAVRPRLGQRAAVFPDLVRGQVADVGLAGLDELDDLSRFGRDPLSLATVIFQRISRLRPAAYFAFLVVTVWLAVDVISSRFYLRNFTMSKFGPGVQEPFFRFGASGSLNPSRPTGPSIT